MFITVRLVVFKTYVCNFVCLMLELCSYKPFGLLCSLSYSVLNELRCQMNKPRLNQEVYQIYNSYPEVQRGNDVVNDGLKPSFTAYLTP